MKFKLLILLMCLYVVAFTINVIPSIKHPDSNMNIFNLFATILFLLVLLMYSKKSTKKLKILSIFGVISGVLVFVITRVEDFMFNYAILDAIGSIQYPLYLIFTTPLFGINFLFDLSYGTFALLMSLFYIFVFILTEYWK